MAWGEVADRLCAIALGHHQEHPSPQVQDRFGEPDTGIVRRLSEFPLSLLSTSRNIRPKWATSAEIADVLRPCTESPQVGP